MTAPALIDQPARQRIATALDENLCVEAAAGTGKTTVLVDRVVNLLAHTDLTVDQLVVITFTEKAAAELATRVRDRLEDEAAQAERRGARTARDGGSRPVPGAHRDDPQLRDRAATRAAGRGRARPAVRGARGARRQPRLRRRLRALPGRAARPAAARARAGAPARARPARAARGMPAAERAPLPAGARPARAAARRRPPAPSPSCARSPTS